MAEAASAVPTLCLIPGCAKGSATTVGRLQRPTLECPAAMCSQSVQRAVVLDKTTGGSGWKLPSLVTQVCTASGAGTSANGATACGSSTVQDGTRAAGATRTVRVTAQACADLQNPDAVASLLSACGGMAKEAPAVAAAAAACAASPTACEGDSCTVQVSEHPTCAPSNPAWYATQSLERLDGSSGVCAPPPYCNVLSSREAGGARDEERSRCATARATHPDAWSSGFKQWCSAVADQSDTKQPPLECLCAAEEGALGAAAVGESGTTLGDVRAALDALGIPPTVLPTSCFVPRCNGKVQVGGVLAVPSTGCQGAAQVCQLVQRRVTATNTTSGSPHAAAIYTMCPGVSMPPTLDGTVGDTEDASPWERLQVWLRSLSNGDMVLLAGGTVVGVILLSCAVAAAVWGMSRARVQRRKRRATHPFTGGAHAHTPPPAHPRHTRVQPGTLTGSLTSSISNMSTTMTGINEQRAGL